jgi:pimeloyl-ACP methyl ester carboxylesterase/predicted glycosyltransferase
MRAREPDRSGYATNDGIRVYYEVYGDGPVTVLMMPTWAIVHSRMWKMQIPYLARYFRVVTFDPRGNGRTDRPEDPARYGIDAIASDTVAVLDATDTDRAVIVAHCQGTRWAVKVAAQVPDRVAGFVAISTSIPLSPPPAARMQYEYDDVLPTDEGWAKYNRHYWLRDWPGFVEFFAEQMSNEARSTKAIDDVVEWGTETDGHTMVCESDASAAPEDWPDLVGGLTCPVLAIGGDRDQITTPDRTRRLAELTGGELLWMEGTGHLPYVRHPVVVNHAIKSFVDRVTGRPPRETAWLFARERKRRALYVSSPIGLGHVLRDLAIARALREQVPDLQIEWLAQNPVTRMLEAAGEIIHPASAEMASESAHWESEATGHDLHAFNAFRRMDEIFCANYMLFDDVVRETPYDVWIGDESWEVDHFLHENPERKIAPYVFTTDVVGFLPVQDDPREIEVTADYNAEMIEHRERHPRVRDVSLYIGAIDELPDESFGPGLPRIREWTSKWFDTVPYIVPFDPRPYRDPAGLRQRLGYAEDGPLLAAAVGGTAVGRPLLELIAEGFGYLRKDLPEARMTMVTGPRIDPRELPDVEGLEKTGFLPDAFAHLAAADAAVVQGGLSTTMELVAAGRPFVYFPIARHWEQQHFVAHRLRYYRAGIPLDYQTTNPRRLAAAMRTALRRRPRYRPIPSGGATQAATRIATLLTRR